MIALCRLMYWKIFDATVNLVRKNLSHLIRLGTTAASDLTHGFIAANYCQLSFFLTHTPVQRNSIGAVLLRSCEAAVATVHTVSVNHLCHHKRERR